MTGKIREIVAYAAERHILIVPEIEIPGHSREVVMCYPSFSCVDESVFMDMIRTPGQYDLAGAVCPGNDEVVKFIKAMVDDEYAGGRNTIMGDDELDTMVRLYDVELHKLFNERISK